MDKEDVVCIYNRYYSAITKNEILPSARMWREVECVLLSEISYSEKDKYYGFTHMCSLRNKINEHRARERKKKQREANHKRLLTTDNKLRVA